MKETSNYLVKVTLLVTDDVSGKEKKVTEQYRVEGVNVTDVETIINQEFQGESAFESIKSVTVSPIIKHITK